MTRGGGTSRLEADIVWQHEGKDVKETVYFEADPQWEKYFTFEVSDPFILAMFEVAIENGYDIEHEAPVTEDLKYQMETYLVPIFAKKIPGCRNFCLKGPVTDQKIPSESVTGTGFSAGVDSFYTVLSHKDHPCPSKRVTHLLLAVNGAAATGVNAERDRKWFDEEMRLFTPLAEELGCKLIGVNSNVSLLNHYRKLLKGGSGITTSSFVHALRKLFGTYYWASTYEADVLEFRSDDLGYVEPFFLPLLSVEGLRFYHSGSEVNRMEKVEYIADNETVQKGLTVCGGPKSCGICFKCTRTMAELYAVGKLDRYGKVFREAPVYEKKLAKNLGRELAQDHPPFTTEILDKLKSEGKRVPLRTYLWKTFYFKPFLYFKKKLKYNPLAMKLYYEKGWIDKLGEPRPSEETIQAKLRGERLEK